MGLAIDYHVHRTSVDIAKGYRQIEKAATSLSRGNTDSATIHLCKALEDFGAAVDHACTKAGNELDKGNAELQKSFNAYADGHPDIAQGHYDKAVNSFDNALDLLGDN